MTTPHAARARWAVAHPEAAAPPPTVGDTLLRLADPALLRRAVAAARNAPTPEAFVAAVLRTVGIGLADDAGRPIDDVPSSGTLLLDTFVPGIPRPQGSKVPAQTDSGKLYVREQGATNHHAWRHALWVNLRKAWGFRPAVPEGCAWSLTFVMPCPKSQVRKAGQPHTGKPDLDKLIRAVGDACKDAGIVADDSLLCQMREPTLKRYARRNEAAGVYVRLWTLD